MLPVLTAVLAGALVAGAATMVSEPPTSTADQGEVSLAVPDAQSADQGGGDIGRPEQGDPSSGAPATSTSPTSSTTTPPSSTPSAPASSSSGPPAPSSADPPPPAPEPAQPGGSRRDQVVEYVNRERQERGCGPVRADSQLAAAAQGHSEDMSNRDYFSHTTPEGVTFDQRIRNAGYNSPGAENIAYGARTAADVMEMWMNSEGHRANILNCRLNAIGVGLDTDGWYWTQNFGY